MHQFIGLALIVAMSGVTPTHDTWNLTSSQSATWDLASNGAKVVKVARNGSLEIRNENGGKFRSVIATVGERFSSVMWDGRYFIATGFFSVSYSRDGESWEQMDLPTGTYFDPGNIISDEEFFDSSAMSLNEIEAFIDSKVDQCRPGYVCLEDYREQTWNRDATVLCDRYSSGGRESAAEIIYKVSNACGVSPEVLLVLLQKEQGLITHTWPSSWRFEKATGYACPDTAPCDTQYYGFYNQVYNAAKQFKRYANPPGTSKFFTWYPVGRAGSVLYHPNSACGRKGFTIENQATAGLYYYTPYTPNAESIAAYSGLGNSCSSYGNRNFWRYFNLWFAQGGDYQNWSFTKNGEGHVVDQNGTTLAVNLNEKSWAVAKNVPASMDNRIVGAGVNAYGKTVVQREDGRQYWIDPSGNWTRQAPSTLRTPGLERFISTKRPVVSGVAEVGEVLSVSVEGWEPVPDSFEYRWLADGKRIRGEEQLSLTLTKDLLGKNISVLVRGIKARTLTVNLASTKTTAVTLPKISATGRPVLSGDAIEGETLLVSVEGWEPVPERFEYRWFADGKRLVGENGESLEISESMVGRRISVRVKALKPGFQSQVRFSAKTEPVMPFD